MRRATRISGPEAPRRGGEIGRISTACDIGVARSINRYADAPVVVASAEVRGIDQHRVNHQRLASVISRHAESCSTLAAQHISSGDHLSLPANFLVDDR